MPPGQQVKVHKSASFVDILEVCKFTTFCDRKGYREFLKTTLKSIPSLSCIKGLNKSENVAMLTKSKLLLCNFRIV